MSYVKITNGQPENYSIGQLRRDNPNTSFPKRPSDELLAGWGIYPVTPTPQPEYDTIHEYLESSFVIEGDKAVQVWTPTRRETIPEVDQVAAEQVRVIKSAVGEAILARLPYHRQLNYQQRAIELLDIRRQRELTEEETADYAHIMVERNWLDAMRAESNRLEMEVLAIAAAVDLSDDQKRTTIAALTFEALP